MYSNYDIFIRNIMVKIFLLVQTQHVNDAVQMWETQNVGDCRNVIDEVETALEPISKYKKK